MAAPFPRSLASACEGFAGLAGMTIATVIHAGLRQREQHTIALVLMGGGARTAYQVGVLRALASILRTLPGGGQAFPFPVLVGTSAGAINAAFLAASAQHGLHAFVELADFWSRLRSSDVYRLDVPPWVRLNRWLAALVLSRHVQSHGAILDSSPLAAMLLRGIPAGSIDASLRSGKIAALAVCASSYTSGMHWTFCQTPSPASLLAWQHPGRRGAFEVLRREHLLASSAIPFLFPAVRLRVDGADEYFGDGSMRQIAPLSPAMHLGASRILVIGVGPVEPPCADPPPVETAGPTLGDVAGHVMASVFHDTLQADVEQTQRASETIRQLAPAALSATRFQPIRVLAIAPTSSLDELAQQHRHVLPAALRDALAALGMLAASGGALASYLLFEPAFVNALIDLGERDATLRRDELLALFCDT